jgi:hypothetical protein
MRLIFLHGINQDGRDPVLLQNEWIEDLEKGFGRRDAFARVDIAMPFYGDALIEAAKMGPSRVVPQGGSEDEDRDLARFLAEGLEEQARAAGVTSQQIVAAQETAAVTGQIMHQDFPMSRRINAIVGLFERISPLHGDLALRLLGQAYAYLKKPWVREAVDAIVDPALNNGPITLVSHSLGTVIGFRLLRQRALSGSPVDIPLFVTLGSPLALATVQRAIGPAFTNPKGVARWLNLRDPADFIALNRSLEPPRFAGPIENMMDIENPGADPHAIPGYLSHAATAKAIGVALGL